MSGSDPFVPPLVPAGIHQDHNQKEQAEQGMGENSNIKDLRYKREL